MQIKHNAYFDGAHVQSLGCVGEDGETEFTIGMVKPGSYDFGSAARKETIEITSGVISFNGVEYAKGEVCVIEPGGEIKVEAKEVATYVCHYG